MPATKLTRYVHQCKIQPIILLMIMLTDIFYLSYVFVYNNNGQSHDLYYSINVIQLQLFFEFVNRKLKYSLNCGYLLDPERSHNDRSVHKLRRRKLLPRENSTPSDRQLYASNNVMLRCNLYTKRLTPLSYVTLKVHCVQKLRYDMIIVNTLTN